MNFNQIRVDGEDFIGLMGFATDKYAIISPKFKEDHVLDVPTLKTRLYGTNLVGMFCAGNSFGLVLPYFTTESEYKKIIDFSKEVGFNVVKLDGKNTALGNLITANDKAALISETIRNYMAVEEVLDVETTSMTISGQAEVGGHVLATNRGFITHPVAQDQIEDIKEILKVEGMTGTVNCGVPYVKSGLIANSNGYITGMDTTGIELQRIDDALGFF